jgi:hypothetical protein
MKENADIVMKNPPGSAAHDTGLPARIIGGNIEGLVKDSTAITGKHVNTAQEIQSKEEKANAESDSGPMAPFFS